MKETRAAVIGKVKLKATLNNGELTNMSVSAGVLDSENIAELLGWLNGLSGVLMEVPAAVRVNLPESSHDDSPLNRGDAVTIVDMETGVDETKKRLQRQ